MISQNNHFSYNIPRPSQALTTFLATATAPAATIKLTPLTNFRFVPLSFFTSLTSFDSAAAGAGGGVVVVVVVVVVAAGDDDDLEDIFSFVSCTPFFVTSLLATSVAFRTLSLVFGTTGSAFLGAGADGGGVVLLTSFVAASPLPKNDFCAAVISMAYSSRAELLYQ